MGIMTRFLKLIFLFGILELISLSSARDSNSESYSDSDSIPVPEMDASYNCTCGWRNKNLRRIISGNDTRANEYPMMAGLVVLNETRIVCGGIIITKWHIVTAAHCTEPYQPDDIGIFTSPHHYNKVKYGKQLVEPKTFYHHDKYVRLTLKYDISLILLKRPIKFTGNVGPACLPTEHIPLVGEKVRLLGWGQTSYMGNTSTELEQVFVDVVDGEMCKPHYPQLDLDDPHQICTYTDGSDACKGDAGGPLLWKDKNTGKYNLVGIISYGRYCGKIPAVNIDIAKFLPWIQRKISETKPKIKTCAKVIDKTTQS